MPTIEKVYQSIMSGMHDNNVKFRDLQNLLLSLGFQQKENNGDHFLYNYPCIKKLINIQPDKKNHAMAKGYQIRQIRNFLKQNNITFGGVENDEI